MNNLNSKEYILKTIGSDSIVEFARVQYPKLGRGAVVLEFSKKRGEIAWRYIPWTYIKEIGFDKLVPGFNVEQNEEMISTYSPLHEAYIIVLSEYEKCAYPAVVSKEISN